MKNLYLLPLLFLLACGGTEKTNNSENSNDTTIIESDTGDTQADNGNTGQTDNQSEHQNSDEVISNKNSNDDPLKAVLGKWQYVKSICCGRAPVTYPDSLSTTVEFTSEGKVVYYHGKDFYKKLPFKVGMGEIYEGRPYLQIGNKYKGLLNIDGNNMVLDFGYMDLHTEYYTRIK